MDQEAVIADIESKAWEAGVSIRRVCTLAGVHPTTFSRWKKSERNPDPIGANLKTIRQLYAALDELRQAAPKRRARSAVA
jgi:hypothetical protein